MVLVLHDKTLIRPDQYARGGGSRKAAAAIDHSHSSVGMSQVLFSIANANMNIATDQPFIKRWGFTNYIIEEIRIRDADGTCATAVGGIYTGAGKTGTILVAAAQAYTQVSGVGLGLVLTLTAAALAVQTTTPIFALTTPQGAARIANLEIIGIPLSEP